MQYRGAARLQGTFRIDRMWRTALDEGVAAPLPEGFDAVAQVTRSLTSVPWRWEVEVVGCSFTIGRPDELRASVRALAERLAAQV